MAISPATGRSPETIAFPPVLLAGELQHIFCNAGDADEFLASAHAWLELFVLAQDPQLGEAEVWSRTQAAHDEGLTQVSNDEWRAELEARLTDSLLKMPAYKAMWDALPSTFCSPRAYH